MLIIIILHNKDSNYSHGHAAFFDKGRVVANFE